MSPSRGSSTPHRATVIFVLGGPCSYLCTLHNMASYSWQVVCLPLLHLSPLLSPPPPFLFTSLSPSPLHPPFYSPPPSLPSLPPSLSLSPIYSTSFFLHLPIPVPSLPPLPPFPISLPTHSIMHTLSISGRGNQSTLCLTHSERSLFTRTCLKVP